jgi:hypothetical protein
MFLRVGLDGCYFKSLFLKLGFTEPQSTAEGCQVFREMEMRNGRRVFFLPSKICMYKLKLAWRQSTLIIPSLIARRQSIAARSRSFLILWSSQSAQLATDSRCVRRNDRVIDHFEVSC